jgi:hypothetical protein
VATNGTILKTLIICYILFGSVKALEPSNFMTTNGIVPDVRAGMHLMKMNFANHSWSLMKIVNDHTE